MAERFNPTPRTLAENLALEKKIRAMSGAYGKNRSNYGGGAQLRSTFDLEGPESLGANINIPALDGGFGSDDRRNVLGQLGLGASSDPSVQAAIREELKDRTSGSESFNFPVERFSFGPEGNFLGGLMEPQETIFGNTPTGDLPTSGGPTFNSEDNLQEIMADLTRAERQIKDNAILPRFDQELIEGTGEGLATGNIKNVLKSESDEIDALLGNDPVFDDPMGDIAAELAEIEKAKRIKKELIRNETELSEAQTPAEKKYFDTPGGGGRDAAAMSKEKKEKTENNAEKAFIASMDDFVLAARGENPKGPKNKTIEQYKQEFADATGIDVSGKVDNRLALMAGGLSLLQNKAGKDFNVGKMLKSFGEAGEAAMPALTTARNEAKKAGLSAGKFALEMQSSDETKRKTAAEKAMNRAAYYVMPKGEGIGGFIKNMDKAKKQRLNVFELNALTTNPEFDENFEVISAANYTAIATKAMESPEAVENFASTKTKQALFSGDEIDPMFILDVFDVNPNIENGPEYGKISGGSKAHEPVYRALSSSLKALNRADEKLAGAVALVEGGAANTTNQLVSWFKGVGSQLGIVGVEGNSPTEQLQFYLKSLKVENAAAILGEAGKTLSDSDRALVEEIISKLSTVPFNGDNPEVIVAKLKEFRIKIIEKKRNDIKEAYRNLDGFARQDTSALWSDGQWSEDDDAEYKRLVKKYKSKED